jgi:hypothetical protein
MIETWNHWSTSFTQIKNRRIYLVHGASIHQFQYSTIPSVPRKKEIMRITTLTFTSNHWLRKGRDRTRGTIRYDFFWLVTPRPLHAVVFIPFVSSLITRKRQNNKKQGKFKILHFCLVVSRPLPNLFYFYFLSLSLVIYLRHSRTTTVRPGDVEHSQGIAMAGHVSVSSLFSFLVSRDPTRFYFSLQF